MRTLATLVLSLFTLVPVAADPIRVAGTDVRFTVTKLGYEDVVGHFREFNADIRYDAANPERSVVQWRVRIASVETGATNRDRSLQMPEYFDAARYPEMTFMSRSVRRISDDALQVTGDLTIRGITKQITIPVRASTQQGRRTFVTDFTLDRYDYDVRGGSVMGRLIGRTVRVHLAAVEGEGR
jgi:polyisoprenoid-binding protein YceI